MDEEKADPRLALMVGLPRAGKTTIAKAMETQGWVRVCPDDVRRALHGRQYEVLAEQMVWTIVTLMVRTHLIGGRKVVLDACNASPRIRHQWVQLAQDFHLTLECLLVRTPYEVCAARNIGPGAVPPSVLERMRCYFSAPTKAEGDTYEAVFGPGSEADTLVWIGWRLVSSPRGKECVAVSTTAT